MSNFEIFTYIFRYLPIHSVVLSAGPVSAYGAQVFRTTEWMIRRVRRPYFLISSGTHHTRAA